jgi:protein-arginine kinase activator protein McsA
MAWRIYSQQQQTMQTMSEKLLREQMQLEEMQKSLSELQRHKSEEHGEIRGQIRSLQEQINAHLSGRQQ